MKRNDILEREAEIRQWIKEKRTKAYICMKLGCKHVTLESYLVKLGIIYQGNQGRKGQRRSEQIKPAVAYLHKGSKVKTHDLKLKLIRDGLKLAECESCFLKTWFNGSIPLELHHINGDRHDNRLKNLQLLCPNCHALTENYSGKMTKKQERYSNSHERLEQINEDKINARPVTVLVFDNPEAFAQWREENIALENFIDKSLFPASETVKRRECLHCGKFLTRAAQDTYCSAQCSQLATRRVTRPSKEELTKMIWEMPTSQLARRLGVSDVAIAKWCKSYNIPKPPRGYWTKQIAKNSKS